MSKRFFPKLAVSNIKKNAKTYIPYILTCSLTVAMFYIVRSLSLNPGLEGMLGENLMSYTLFLGSRIVAIFAFIFLLYTNSFLVRRRKKEFGVFNILGMEKRHISEVIGWESMYVAFIGLTTGLVCGIALDKVMFLTVSKAIGGEVPLGFFISYKAISETVVLFAVIFFLIFVRSVWQIHMANPVELLHAGNVGEKEPKTNWLMAILGVVSLGAGYFIAITTKNPAASIQMFFAAVILVIAGTYMVFTSGSIALLKTLRRNKRYYYKTKHFSGVSGMIYRMKQNAAGLANICILSTMVLIMVSTTASLMIGVEDVLSYRYPTDFAVYSREEAPDRAWESFDDVRKLQQEEQLHITNEIEYTYLQFAAIPDGDTFQVDSDVVGSGMFASINTLFFISLTDYNAAMGENMTLHDGEIMIYSKGTAFEYPVLRLFDKEYTIVKRLNEFVCNGNLPVDVSGTQYIVVPDRKDIDEIYDRQKEALADIARNIRYFYGFDTDDGDEEQHAFYQALDDMYGNHGYVGTLEAKVNSRQEIVGFYAGFFFLGVFLSVLFVMATVLIIYYKQISEGYDDRGRFEIMQKVGMSRSEIKATIHSQVLTVFFLPLIAAGIHVMAAFPMFSKMLMQLDMFNTKLYIACTAVCFLVFAVVYVMVYALTAKSYYRIVSR